MSALLEVEGLRLRLPTPNGMVTIVDGVDFLVREGEVFGLAGESGSGKTLSVLTLLRLLPPRAIVEGRAVYAGRDLFGLRPKQLREVRGREIAMVFQDPTTSLHPMLPIGRTLTEHLRHHFKLSRRDARTRAIEMLDDVRIPNPEDSLSAYPHQFSGGMRQRIAIASALICRPRLLIADEPTTALDVTVQAGIIRLIDRLRRDSDLSVILITHDLGVLSSIADAVSVMYAGRVIESGAMQDVLQRPRHPYTRALLAALPHSEAPENTPLQPIAGAPPTPRDPVSGCSFHPRCPHRQQTCSEREPALVRVAGRRVACPVDPFKAA